MAIIGYALAMEVINFKAAQQKKAITQAMVNDCCVMSQNVAATYLRCTPQQYFNGRKRLAQAIHNDLCSMAQTLHFDIHHDECQSFSAIIAAWPNSELFNKALLLLRNKEMASAAQTQQFRAIIEQHIQLFALQRPSLEGLLGACLIAFTCTVADVFIQSRQPQTLQ